MNTPRAVVKLHVAVLLAALLSLPFPARADSTETSTGPISNWSFGWKDTPTGTFAVFQNQFTYYGMPAWYIDSANPYPLVAFNDLGATMIYRDLYSYFAVPKNRLVLHPSNEGRVSVVRWRADATGSFRIQGFFDGLDQCVTAKVYVVVNATDVVLESPVGGPAIVDFSSQSALASGDTVDFVVDNGGNGHWCDAVGLTAMISSIFVR